MVGGAVRRGAAALRAVLREIEGPRYHPDVRNVGGLARGGPCGGVRGDYFAARASGPGAWCSDMRPQWRLGGESRPIV
jgi:peptidyl-dipeptidase Dcp